MKNQGTLIINTIRPYDSADTYPSAVANEIKGGHYQVATLTERDLITSLRRTEGMLCWVISESKTYRLVGGIDNTNWTEITTIETDPLSLHLNGDNWVANSPLSYSNVSNTLSINLTDYLTESNAANTYVPLTREITINGVTQDLTNNISYSITSASYPQSGVAISNGSAWVNSISGLSTEFIKGDGSLDNTIYLITEVDPIFTSSNAFSITSHDLETLANTSNLNSGDQWVFDGGTA